jgi:DNA-binding HxlR family transcriptional regulator
MAKTYGQFCSTARALDVVGDRWALLVVRELLLGPCRFTDLLTGLPGIGTNVLSTRLRELEAAGVVERRRLPAPTPVTLYQLTPAGRDLRQVVDALARWGSRRLDVPAQGDVLEPRWLVLSLAASVTPPAELEPGATIRLRIEDEEFIMTVDDGSFVARRGAGETADAALLGPLADFFAAAKGDRRAADRIARDGDPAVGRGFLDAVVGALAPTDTRS